MAEILTREFAYGKSLYDVSQHLKDRGFFAPVLVNKCVSRTAYAIDYVLIWMVLCITAFSPFYVSVCY